MRFFLLSFLLFSFVFACDFPHEEVGGYKIGCPYEGNGKLKQDSSVKIFEEKLDGVFFETAEIALLNGNIEKITFTTFYNDSSQSFKKIADFSKDRDALISSISEKWGDYKELDVGGGTALYTIRDPKSDVLNSVFVIQMPDSAYSTIALSITYSSKKLNDYEEELSVKEKEERSKQLEGF